MFTKVLIFVLLGTTLVLANPTNINAIEEQTEKSWKVKVQDWLQHVEEILKDYYEQGKKTFEEALNDLKQKSQKAVEIGKETYAELKEKYNDIKTKAQKDIEEIRKLWEVRLEEWKHKGEEALEQGKEKFEELKEKAKHALNEAKTKWETKLKDWKQKAKKAIENAKVKIYKVEKQD